MMFDQLENEGLDAGGFARLLGLDVETLVRLLGLEVMHVEDDGLRDGLELLVCALEGAVRRELVGLRAAVAELDEERLGEG